MLGLAFKRETFLLMFALAILVSTAVMAETPFFAAGNFIAPEHVPAGIHITSSGEVQGTDKIQASGNTFTLTGDLDKTIAILRDGVVLDGAGHTLRGSGSGIGVFLQGRNQVTIKNLRITGFEYGIKTTWLTYDGGSGAPRRSLTISGNTIFDNKHGIAFADFISEIAVSNNYFSDNTYAFYASKEAVLRNNHFRNNDYCFYSDIFSANFVDTSNKVNDKPMIFWVNQENKAVPADAGWVFLKNCRNITVQGLNLNDAGEGLILYNTSNSKISNNTITNNINGITLKLSSQNTISNNFIANNKQHGISIEPSIYGDDSSNNSVTNNKIIENGEAGVVISTYRDYQFATSTAANTLTKNTISKNGIGVWIENSVGNTIILNDIKENTIWGIKLEGTHKDNIIHHNNFIDNKGTGLQVCISGLWSFSQPNPESNSNGGILFGNGSDHKLMLPNEPEFVGGSANLWDDGKGGNYWSDYLSRYANTSEVGTTGVGDTPFYINENNIDRYPLIAPIDISIAQPSALNSQQYQNSEEQQNSFLNIIITIPLAALALASAGIVIYVRRNGSKRSSLAQE